MKQWITYFILNTIGCVLVLIPFDDTVSFWEKWSLCMGINIIGISISILLKNNKEK